jgi:lipopolysaccharide biosynthesis protein
MQAFQDKIRPIAFHLPQFHTIPENDTWWGKGFTEWTNVKRAKPLFRGHEQPHVPLNNNYYDLSQLDNLHWQKDLARKHGIHGFCFYHYWFNGKLLLEKPLELILNDDTWDFPFCLCWANENWTRTWDGQENDILLKQDYSINDDRAHFEYFIKIFKNHNYIKVKNKPVLLIYRSELFSDINRTTALWREMALKAGLEGLYLIRVEAFKKNIDPKKHGFDASMDFQPDWQQLPKKIKEPFVEKVLRRIKYKKANQFSENGIYSYKQYITHQIHTKSRVDVYKRYPCVMPSWDNSARKQKKALIFKDASPAIYKSWLKSTVDEFETFSDDENFIFINAWNEWGEGNHLEPCEKWGYSYLEATKEILLKSQV